MAEWKFGTVLAGPSATVMVIGRSDGTYRTTDHYEHVPLAGEWIGLTIANTYGPAMEGAYGRPGDTTWVIPTAISNWKVLDE